MFVSANEAVTGSFTDSRPAADVGKSEVDRIYHLVGPKLRIETGDAAVSQVEETRRRCVTQST